MTRMIAFLANQTDRVRCAVSQEADALRFGDGAGAWGLGSVQSGEVLLRRRPVSAREGASLPEMVRDLRTGALVACARRTEEARRPEETVPPWRFRQWLCAVDGDLTAMGPLREALDRALPDFLARNAHGDGADERVAHLLFAQLHGEGRLDDPDLDRLSLARCARDAVRSLDALSGAQVPVSLLATNGRVLVALARGVPLSWVRRQGVRDVTACAEAEAGARPGRRLDAETLRHLRYVMVASGAEVAGYKPAAAEGGLVTLAVDRNLDVHIDAA
ncbi:MAG: hypothetical protein U0325_24480 [Polyangiales bacterium]